jgi:RimJ/RimL family protein N-acetyltransferase
VLRPGYPLETGRLVLRPFEAGDLEGLFAFHSLPEVARFLYWEARDLEQVRAVLEAKLGQTALEEEGQVLALAVVGREAHFVHNEIFKGAWGDELVYAMLEDEWRDQVSGGRPG